MQKSDEMIKKWIDYRVECKKAEEEHTSIAWGKYNSFDSNFEFDSVISAGGIHKHEIQLFVSQYAGKTKKAVFQEVADAIGAKVVDYNMKGYQCFKYRGYTFFAETEYDEGSKVFRQRLEMEV